MISFFRNFFLLLLLCCFCYQTKAQTVAYELVYNETNCNYEAHAHVVSGSASFPNTISLGAQFSILVPAAVPDGILPVDSSLEPPDLTWGNSDSFYAPAVDPAHDYHTFSIDGGSNMGYSTFNMGDDILLFTFSLPEGSCGSGVRLYINGVDPGEGELNGGDFFQSLRILGADETYSGNVSNDEISAEAPTVTPTASCSATEVSLAANATTVCSAIATYAWSGPNGFSSTDENPAFPVDVDPNLQVGTYTLIVTNSKGCATTATIDLGYDNCFVETSCGPLCINNNNITSDAIEPALYNGTIIKSDGMVAPATNVDFIAEECIDLIPEFEVKLGATFLGDIAPCNPQ